MRNRNCIATLKEGDGHDRMRLGGRGAHSSATTLIGPGIRPGPPCSGAGRREAPGHRAKSGARCPRAAAAG